VTAPVVLDSAQELATTVATRLLSVLASAQAEGRDPHVALTGGTIAEAIHREVARLSPGSGVDWTRVHLWWGDERFVEAGSPERNAGQARAAFIDAVGIPDAHVHEVATTEQAADVDAAAASYAEDVRTQAPDELDVVMLGVGPDGHVASLFPGFAQVHVDDVDAVGVTGSPKPPPERVSLTFRALNSTRATWFVVSGDGKAEAVARALDPASTTLEETPAIGAHGREETVWFLDRDAASRLAG
jgi:6-phosphogluconolactonase